MTKQDLAELTAEKSGLKPSESKDLMDATFNVLTGYLSVEHGVTIPHFGTFDVRMRKGHRFFNFIRAKIMFAPRKFSIFFHPSKEYKEKIHQKLKA